jgi:AcrR family transcriptional regulator
VVIADQLIRSKGYNAFSYSDIANRLNLKNAAIHYHFPSKAELGQAVIIESREKFTRESQEWAGKSEPEQIRLFLEMYRNNRKNGGICFMGALGTSFDTLPEEMQIELRRAHKEIIDWLIQMLEKGKKEKILHFDSSSKEMADLITSSMMASLILERLSGQEVSDSIVANLIQQLAEK